MEDFSQMKSDKGFKNKKGFTLLFSVLVISIVLSVSLGVYNLISNQIKLAGTASDSQISFYSSLSAMECVRYWELMHPNTGIFSAFATSTGASENLISCGGATINFYGADGSSPLSGVGGYSSCVNFVAADLDDLDNPPTSNLVCLGANEPKDGMNIIQIDYPNGTCAKVSIQKIIIDNPLFPPTAPDKYRLHVISQGQNTACSSSGNRTFQRGVEDTF